MAADGMSVNIDQLLSDIPLDDIASSLGVDRETASRAVQGALPGLLGGMAVNASDEDGAGRLTAALKQHEGQQFARLKDVDTDDGAKIVNHVLGDRQQDVALALGQQAGGGIGDLIPKLLPMLAPIVMAFLAKQVGGGAGGSSSTQAQPADVEGMLGDLLGGLMGGGSGGSSGGGLGDLLGGGGSDGGLDGLLGGLLGR